jgi:hypothetical protein
MANMPAIENQPKRSLVPHWRRRPWHKVAAVLVLVVVLAGVGAGSWYLFGKRVLPPSGGVYYPGRLELKVPLFLQGDPKWGHDFLALAPRTLGQVGCAVSAAAMVMKFYGVDTDPGRLNVFLRDSGGFDENNDLRWEGPVAMAPALFRKAYEDLPSYYLIDSNLYRGNPVIVRVHLPSGWTHFVVIMGKQGFDYLIRDPSSAGLRKGVYPLREIGQPMEALRFYQKLNG